MHRKIFNHIIVITVALLICTAWITSESRPRIPDFDWTFHGADNTFWGIRVYEEHTVVFRGWDSFSLPLPFYLFVTLISICLVVTGIGVFYFLLRRRGHKSQNFAKPGHSTE